MLHFDILNKSLKDHSIRRGSWRLKGYFKGCQCACVNPCGECNNAVIICDIYWKCYHSTNLFRIYWIIALSSLYSLSIHLASQREWLVMQAHIFTLGIPFFRFELRLVFCNFVQLLQLILFSFSFVRFIHLLASWCLLTHLNPIRQTVILDL